MRTARCCLLVSFIVLLLAAPVRAESTDCTNPSLLVADGRIVQSTFPAPQPGHQNTTFWYGFYGQAGHSYSVEFVSPADNYPAFNGNTITLNSMMIWGPNDKMVSCNGQSSVGWTRTDSYSPVLMHWPGYGGGERLSFIASTAGLYVLTISNSGGTGAYAFRVLDTMLFNPRWSTYSGYDTQWGFSNVSDMDITGTLSVYDAGNKLLKTAQPTIPAGGVLMRSSYGSDLNLPRNASGYAIFAYVGPPGAILADAYMLNSSATLVIYAKFEHPSQ